jgi:hypothetical protein
MGCIKLTYTDCRSLLHTIISSNAADDGALKILVDLHNMSPMPVGYLGVARATVGAIMTGDAHVLIIFGGQEQNDIQGYVGIGGLVLTDDPAVGQQAIIVNDPANVLPGLGVLYYLSVF